MKKSDYGEVRVSIEVRDGAVIVEGKIPSKHIKAIMNFAEAIYPGGLMGSTCEDCRHGGITVLPGKNL